MSFPETHFSFIQRLASQGQEADWQTFLADYWGPVYRFALRRGAGTRDEAEDVAAETFEVLWQNRLLVRWAANRSAKLRTLLCRVVRNLLANRSRGRARRQSLQRKLAELLESDMKTADAETDVFYAAWVEDLTEKAVESLAAEYYRKDQGDYVRVLYGRLCEGLTIAEVAELLAISPKNVDYFFRHARDRLGEKLKELLGPHVRRYCDPGEYEAELAAEWRHLGHHLAEHGGLEEAVRRAFELLDPCRAEGPGDRGMSKANARLAAAMRSVHDAKDGRETS
jgi:RNA polymerase sigma factor (sigma-70 family)